MTIAEQLITKGRQEGMQQGMQQEATKTLLKILEKRFGSVSQSIKDQVSTATTSQIEAWIDDSLDAESIEQLFDA